MVFYYIVHTNSNNEPPNDKKKQNVYIVFPRYSYLFTALTYNNDFSLPQKAAYLNIRYYISKPRHQMCQMDKQTNIRETF